MGETCIPINPQRIVTLWTTILGNTLALGIKPIASTYYTGEPFPKYLQDQVDGIEFIGNLTEPSLEKILQLKPDLVLANSRLDNIYDPLSRIAPTVIMSFPIPPPPWKQQLIELAKVLDKQEVGQKLMDEYWQRIETLKQALDNRRNQIQVSVASLSPEYGIWAYGEKSSAGTVIKDIGLQRPPAQRGDFYVIENISEERLSDIDGDVLFFLVRGEKGAKEMLQNLQQKPLWGQLKVVQQNQIYFVDAGHWHSLDILAMNAVIDDLFKYLIND
ncbi:iron-siderophore ABC transporter substrate-binding protein [Chroococcidiopsis sp. CCMEE 29]|uniref:iron-siderophore ABC transporter substrate-binding protein n=1 Tax=Chroococcidiopsis sp. CCMEE 29 TaxID=155894 RepID=UPI0020221E77|nr:iron-siderophore ABC transporter substrate-binding protein [Chroococcidiopsis sp. CCMEE 29]